MKVLPTRITTICGMFSFGFKDFLVQDLQVTRQTASKYLDQLVALNLITLHKIGKENYYINDALYNYLYNAPEILKFAKPIKG